MSGESEEEMPGEITKNPDYEPPSMKDLFKMSLSGWVHHVEYILPQVIRTVRIILVVY